MSTRLNKLEDQLTHGVLDLDGLETITSSWNPETRPFILGGYEDLDAFLFFLMAGAYKDQVETRVQLIVKDYETHWIAVDLYSCETSLHMSPQRVECLVVDSTPDRPPWRNNVGKWRMALERYFVTSAISVYTNSETLQNDHYSCKIFALNAVRRMAKLSPRELYNGLGKLTASSGFPARRLLQEHGLPPQLMKDVQSISRIERYILHHTNTSTHIWSPVHVQALWNHAIRKHGVLVTAEGTTVPTKLQNHSIVHSLQKMRDVQMYPFVPLPSHGQKRRLPNLSTPDAEGDLLMQYARLRGIHLDHPTLAIELLHCKQYPDEATYKEDMTTALTKRLPETCLDASLSWDLYKAQLVKRAEDTRELTWWDTACTYTDSTSIVPFNMTDWNYLKDFLTNESTSVLLSHGCSQPLAAWAIVLAAVRLATERAT